MPVVHVSPRRAAAVVLVITCVAGGALAFRPLLTGLTFVIRAANLQGTLRQLADASGDAVQVRELQLPTSERLLRARHYTSAATARRTALLVSGLHPAGIDEPRLVDLARDLAASGVAVVTPDIEELSAFVISPAITDQIEQAARWLADQPAFAPDGRITMMGISFSGGLSVVAAGRPALDGKVASVFSFGGHADLPRVLRYLCTGVEPTPQDAISRAEGANTDRRTPAPHDYGVAVMLLGVADRIVPRPQVDALRDGVRKYLWASHLDRVDKPQADRELAETRALADKLPEPSATLLRYVVTRDVARLGSRLLPFVGWYGGDPALSPSRSPLPEAPVFLLHGRDDNVIPAAESVFLGDALRARGEVRLLLSDLITHAEADRAATVGNITALAEFWGDLLWR